MLPGDVDADRVEAHLVDGVLTVTVPKAQAAKPWHIEVSACGRRGGAVSVDAAWPITTNREPIGSYNSYEEAQKVVDHLSDHGFPVRGTLIVGAELRSVEQVVARMTHLRAAGRGAAGGAWFGLLIGLFLAIFTTTAAFVFPLVLWGLLWGAVAGAIFGLISYALLGGKRDFISESALVANRYEVLVESGHAAKARELLRGMTG
jgi:hypothetical protein